MLRADSAGWFTSAMVVLREGDIVTRLEGLHRGRFTLNGEAFTIRRDGFAGVFGPTILLRGETTVASAQKPNPFSRRFLVNEEPGGAYANDTPLELIAAGAFSRAFLVERAGENLGGIRPVSAFRSTALVELPDEVALPTQIFLLWLVVLTWRQSNGD